MSTYTRATYKRAYNRDLHHFSDTSQNDSEVSTYIRIKVLGEVKTILLMVESHNTPLTQAISGLRLMATTLESCCLELCSLVGLHQCSRQIARLCLYTSKLWNGVI